MIGSGSRPDFFSIKSSDPPSCETYFTTVNRVLRKFKKNQLKFKILPILPGTTVVDGLRALPSLQQWGGPCLLYWAPQERAGKMVSVDK